MTIAPDTINDMCYLVGTDVICTSSAWYTIGEQRVEIPNHGALLGIQAPAILGKYNVYFNNKKIGSCGPYDYGKYEMRVSRVFVKGAGDWPMTSVSNKYFCLGMHCDYIHMKGKLEIEFEADQIKKIHTLHTNIAVLDEHTRLPGTAELPGTAKAGFCEALITLQHRNKVYQCNTLHHKCPGRLSIDRDGTGGY